MNNTVKVCLKLLMFCLIIIMMIQICISFMWMKRSVGQIPSFGDTGEYLELSETLILDEYRPILYPLFLRVIIKFGDIIQISYYKLVYLLQSMVFFGASWYTLSVVLPKKIKYRHVVIGFCTAYMMSIPMITFMNFSILTDSLAVSMLLIIISCIVRLLREKHISILNILWLVATVLAESLLRADRFYSCIIFLLVFFGLKVKKDILFKVNWKKTGLILIAVMVSIGVIVKGVNSTTQIKGVNERIETNFSFILLDRIVWSNMRENYETFPAEIKAVISKKEAKSFDKHNNRVMYELAPALEEKVGKKEAERMYRAMALIVFKNQPGKIIGDIVEDLLCVVFTTQSTLLSKYKLASTAHSWNIKCVSGGNKQLTQIYDKYYLHTFNFVFIFLLVLAGCCVLKERKVELLKSVFEGKLPYIAMSLIIAAWFSIGDGAPPNDRYALIVYLTEFLLLIGFVEVILGEQIKKS